MIVMEKVNKSKTPSKWDDALVPSNPYLHMYRTILTSSCGRHNRLSIRGKSRRGGETLLTL